ncbi:MAG: DUF2341 domain-containing protein, partial [Candidatus Dojkabacteria bacterium]|nr:DUF2341 domain-containing protein [Candidatus Dojkabacteria bacterium]
MDKKDNKKKISWRKLIVLISVFIVLILFPIALYIYFSQSPEGVAWMNPDWMYRKAITVSNSGGELTNEDVLVTIDTESLIDASKLQADCDDLRFTDSDESTALDYWVEGGCDTSTTRVWVQIPTLPNGGKTIYVYYANPSAANAEESWSGVFISLYDASCPTGWTRDTNFDSKFPYGSSAAGSTGGSESHTHGNYSGGTSSNGTSSWGIAGGSTDIAEAHNHGYTLVTNTNSDVWPPYLNMVFCNNSDYNPYTGMITLFDATVPSGWTRFSALDSYFPRGASSYGGTGGATTHTHTYNSGTTGICATANSNLYGSGMTAGAGGHSHAWSAGSLDAANNMPPYKTVIWGEADGATTLDQVIFMVTANPPLGWSAQSGFNDYFFYGASTFGTTSGTSTHTHSKTVSTGGGASVTVGSGSYHGGSAAGHTFSVTTNAQSNLPPYRTVIVSKRKTSVNTSLGSEESSAPTAPTIGTPSALSTTSIRWTFTDNSSDELGFKVYDNSDNLVVTCDTPNISYCDETGLSTNTQYTRKVVAYNNSGNSNYTDTASAYTLMSVPTISYGGNKTVSSIYLQSSDAINGSQMYFDCTDTGCDTGLNTWVSSTNALAEGLSSNSAYDFRVKSRNGDGVETGYSDTTEIYTLADIPTLELSAAGSTSIQLTGSINNLGVG